MEVNSLTIRNIDWESLRTKYNDERKRKKVTGDWIKLYKDHNFYSSCNVIRVIKSVSRFSGTLVHTEKCVIHNFDKEILRKRPFWKDGHTWKDDINIYHKEIGRGNVDCIHVNQERSSGGLMQVNISSFMKHRNVMIG